MKRVLLILSVIAIVSAACSSSEPPQRFLTAPMSVAFLENGQERVERLQMRPIDLYNTFDLNVDKKRWKQVHENSWKMEIKGHDPASGRKTNMTVTMSVDPKLDETVVVTDMRESGNPFSPDEVSRMVLQLDRAFRGR